MKHPVQSGQLVLSGLHWQNQLLSFECLFLSALAFPICSTQVITIIMIQNHVKSPFFLGDSFFLWYVYQKTSYKWVYFRRLCGSRGRLYSCDQWLAMQARLLATQRQYTSRWLLLRAGCHTGLDVIGHPWTVSCLSNRVKTDLIHLS